jgi:hypothetical protein
MKLSIDNPTVLIPFTTGRYPARYGSALRPRGPCAALETQVRELAERVRHSEQDAAAARVLAGGADRDVEQIRGEIRDLSAGHRHQLQRYTRRPTGTPLPVAAASVQHWPGTATAVIRGRRGTKTAQSRCRKGASGNRALGHHVHTNSVLGPGKRGKQLTTLLNQFDGLWH